MTPGSAWDIWIHPRRTARQMEIDRKQIQQYAEEVRSLRLDQARLQRIADDRAARISEQAESIRSWEAAHAEMEKVAERLERMVDLQQRLAKQRRDYEARLTQMREDYEGRIARLEKQLWSAGSKGLKYAPGASPAGAEPPESSELLDGEDHVFSRPEPIRLTSDRPHIIPPADDTDWLRSLPDL